jgi:glycine dehydrogenase subunit 1
MPYSPATTDDTREMLAAVGASTIDDLFADIPPELRFDGELDLPLGVGESELVAELTRLAARNADASREVSFLGYGAYDHFVPAVCQAITSRSEFATAYTPYQPEISQGTLQAIFEFQTAIGELAGLPVSNASLYDGATAAAEAMYLAQQSTGRGRAVILRTVSGQVRAVVRTYARAYGLELSEVGFDPASGATGVDAVRAALGDDVACLIFQQPGAFGTYEPGADLCEVARSVGAVPVVVADPLSLGVLEAPGAYGAGIVVGEGQALGNSPSFGGPTFGFMAAEERFVRRMPGRIVGQTVDAAGTRAWVLTLQTREQHIRREKATSNICTNQALNALAGIVYLSWLGPVGLERLGTLLLDRSLAVADRLEAVPGVHRAFERPVFKEQVFQLPIPAAVAIERCKQRGVHPGFDIGRDYPELGDNALLVAVTEQRSDHDIEALGAALEEAVR